ncbi:MAG TPA: PilZ domain-containing protein [Pseudobdellovibrionaceae bacterium]|nr:PilZ domain-containing protein [Pseudobdellovibrionaceae bacterium]
MAKSSQTQVKKVKAYPFPAALKTASASFNGNIMKLVPQGCMIEVAGTHLQPGDTVEISFETPVQHGGVAASCVVVKVYNQLTGGSLAPAEASASPGGKPASPSAIRLLELHFRALSPASQSAIQRFLAAIGGATNLR